MLTAPELKWGDPPPVFRKGARMAVVSGGQRALAGGDASFRDGQDGGDRPGPRNRPVRPELREPGRRSQQGPPEV